MSVAGLGSGGEALRETPIVGTVKVASANHAIELKPQQLGIGGSKIDGSVALSYPSEGPAIVTGQIEVDSASMPGAAWPGARPQAGGGGAGRRAAYCGQDHMARARVRLRRARQHRG